MRTCPLSGWKKKKKCPLSVLPTQHDGDIARGVGTLQSEARGEVFAKDACVCVCMFDCGKERRCKRPPKLGRKYSKGYNSRHNVPKEEKTNETKIVKKRGKGGRLVWGEGLHACAIDGDFVALGLGLERFGKHQLAHPVDALVTALGCEMVHLAVRHDFLHLADGGHELELEG